MRAPARTVATGLSACCANRCSAGRLRGRERRRPAVPRSGDALGGRRPGDHQVSRLGQPDGPFRDEVAVPTREPCRFRRSAQPVDRQDARAATAEGHRARHSFEREPDLRRAGRPRLQRPFRLHPLPPAVRVHMGMFAVKGQVYGFMGSSPVVISNPRSEPVSMT
jgi:hypothetical protein